MLLRYINILGLYLLLALSSCSDSVPDFELVEMDPKVVLSFELKNGDQLVDIGDDFKDAEGYSLGLRTLKFYVSDVALVNESGSSEKLSEVELVDFNDKADGADNTFKQYYSYIIPKGNYAKLRFSVGLPSNLNQTDPTTQSSENPLSTLSGMYWDWGSMYVFIMMEAGIDTTGDSSPDANIAFHTGLDTLFRPEQEYAMTFDIPAFAKDTLHVKIDWNKLFNVESSTRIDLSTTPFFHGNADSLALEMTRRFTENFIRAITVEP